jgi:hypothetical protein
MKHLITTFIFSFFIFLHGIDAQTINWATGNGDPCADMGNGTANSTMDPACYTIVDLCRGSGLNQGSGGDFNNNAFDTSNASCADAQADDECLTFGFALAAGCDIAAGSSLEFQLDRSNTGPPNYCLEIDIDGVVTSLSTGTISASTGCVSLSNLPAITSPAMVTFQLCAWGASSGAGTMDIEDGSTSCGGAEGGISFVANTIVPVTFSDLRAMVEHKMVNVVWATSNEENNSFFEVERSNDGTNYDVIEIVNGRGTINRVSEYNTLDKNATQGVNYYRIKQVDIDGRYSYSKVVSVKLGESLTFDLRPTVSSDLINFNSGIEGLVTVFDINGSLVASFNVVDNYKLNVTEYTEGIYIANFKGKNGEGKTNRFIVQH